MSVHFLKQFPVDVIQDSSRYQAKEMVDVLTYIGTCCKYLSGWDHTQLVLTPTLLSMAGILSTFKVGQTFHIMVAPLKALIPPIQEIFIRHGMTDMDRHLIFPVGGVDLQKRIVTSKASPAGYGGKAISKQFSQNSVFNIPEIEYITEVFTGMMAIQPKNLPLPPEEKDRVLLLSFTKSTAESDSDSPEIIGVTAVTYLHNSPESAMIYPCIFSLKEVAAFFDQLEWLNDSAMVLEEVEYPFPEELVESDSLVKYLYEIWSNDQKFEEIRNANSSNKPSGVLVA